MSVLDSTAPPAPSDRICIVNCEFNPISITVIGNIKRSTLEKLQRAIPEVTTSDCSRLYSKVEFDFKQTDVAKPHWRLDLPSGFASPDLGQALILLRIMDALEEEGGWKLRAAHAHNHDVTKVSHKLFFEKKV